MSYRFYLIAKISLFYTYNTFRGPYVALNEGIILEHKAYAQKNMIKCDNQLIVKRCFAAELTIGMQHFEDFSLFLFSTFTSIITQLKNAF